MKKSLVLMINIFVLIPFAYMIWIGIQFANGTLPLPFIVDKNQLYGGLVILMALTFYMMFRMVVLHARIASLEMDVRDYLYGYDEEYQEEIYDLSDKGPKKLDEKAKQRGII